MVVALQHSMSVSYDTVVTARRVQQLLVEASACASEVVATNHVVLLFVHSRLLVVVVRLVVLVRGFVVHWRLRPDPVLGGSRAGLLVASSLLQHVALAATASHQVVVVLDQAE